MLKSLLIATTLFSGVLSPFNSLEQNSIAFTEDVYRFIEDYQHNEPLDSSFDYNDDQYIELDEAMQEYSDTFYSSYLFSFYSQEEDYYINITFANYKCSVNIQFGDYYFDSGFHELDLNKYFYSFSFELVDNGNSNFLYSFDLMFEDGKGYVETIYSDSLEVSGYQLTTGYTLIDSYFFVEYNNFITEVLTEYNKPTNSLFYTIYKGVSNYIDVLKTTFTDMSNIFYVNGSLTPISWLLLIGISIGITKFGLTYLKNQVRK